jgi:hypothetical protein
MVKVHSTKGTTMKVRMKHTVPVVIVAVALGTSGALLGASTGGGAKDLRPPREAVSDCEPPPARCGSEESDLLIVAATEAARRMVELQTTGTTTVTNPVP